MKAIATAIQGLENITIKEIKELTKSKAKTIIPTKVEFTTIKKNYKKFLEYTRSPLNSYELLKKIKFKTINDIKKEVKKLKFQIKNTFAVRCSRIGSHKFSSLDIEKDIGDIICGKVDLKNPDTLIYIDIINNNCLIGMNKKEFKRDYKVKTNYSTINSQLAYSLVRLSGYKKSEALLIPHCSSGEIAIEAALYILKTPLNEKPKQTKLNIYATDIITKNCIINSKIAKIHDLIKIKKLDIGWLDIEFKKNSIDKAIAYLSRKDDCKELLNHMSYVLKNKASLIILTQRNIDHYGFKIIKEYAIKHGADYRILHLRKIYIKKATANI